MDVGLDHTGPDGVHADAVRRHLPGEPEGERVDRALRGGVVDVLVGRPEPRGRRGDEDDRPTAPAPARRQAAGGLAGTEERAHHVDVDRPPDALLRHVDEPRRRTGDPGVDDGAVDRPERRLGGVEQAEHVGLDGDVTGRGDGTAALGLDLCDDRVGGRAIVPVADADRPAHGAGLERDGPPDPAAAAGDDDRPRHPPLPVRVVAAAPELVLDGRGLQPARREEHVRVEPEVGELLDEPLVRLGDRGERCLDAFLAHLARGRPGRHRAGR